MTKTVTKTTVLTNLIFYYVKNSPSLLSTFFMVFKKKGLLTELSAQIQNLHIGALQEFGSGPNDAQCP